MVLVERLLRIGSRCGRHGIHQGLVLREGSLGRGRSAIRWILETQTDG